MQRFPDVEAQAPQARGVRKSRPRKPRRQNSNVWHQYIDGEDPKPNPPKYGDTSAAYWNLYRSEAEISDKNLIEGIISNTGPLIFLSSLFSSVVASFVIEIYKTLLPANNQQTAGSPPSSAVRINIVLFFSLFLSVTSALSCALIHQWCHEYLMFAYPRGAPHECGRVRTYLFRGLNQFQLRRFVNGTHMLLHISFFLFFWGISDFFYTVNHLFGIVTRYALVAAAIVYMLLSTSPLIFSISPYYTPMTRPLRIGGALLRIIIRFPLWCLRWYRSRPFDLAGSQYYRGIHFDRALLYSIEAEEQAEKLEPYAMEWLFTGDDLSDNGMDKFLESLAGYMSSGHTQKGRLDQYLTSDYILTRIKNHFITCATSVELSHEASIARMSSSSRALLRIFQYSRMCKATSHGLGKLKEELQLQRWYIQRLMDDFQTLCGMDDPTIALRASCIRALAVQGFLSQLVSPDGWAEFNPPFPTSFIPIYAFFFPNDNMDTIQLDDGDAPEVRRMWENLLHDGRLANLTTLARDVLHRERAPPSTLSFCWKVLDILLTQLGTIHSEGFTPAQSDFDHLHKMTHTYVYYEDGGFRVTPLLNILDTVARGRRLLMVFSGHPKYHNRADVIFGKEYLRNGDLLEALAHCLPAFISKNSPDVCRDFMEKVVRDDDLWANLQLNLWNTQRSDSPIQDKLRVFEHCCTVIDLAFSVLEGSREVDWRAPEFGSLAQQFESFITYCSQGAFMGRATSFRVGIIKARFCKALLTQFSNDIERDGTVSFRSQWDVASLARLIYTLGLRDKEDAEFWNSYVDGGHIGQEFTAKALKMIDIAARDGPLLIFCQLGHLAATAVPLDQSGVELKDIEKVLELQRKVVEDERLPLDRASDTVWEELSRLRIQVNDLCGKNTGNDIEILRRLLQLISDASNRRFSGPEGPIQSEPAEEQGPETSVAVNPTSSSARSSGESRGISNQFNFASEPTAVTRGPSRGTEANDGEDGFGLQGTPGVGIMDQSSPFPSTISPVIPYFPSIGKARQRRTYTSMSRSGSGFSFTVTRPSLVTRASAVPYIDPSTSATKVDQAELPPPWKSESSSPLSRP